MEDFFSAFSSVYVWCVRGWAGHTPPPPLGVSTPRRRCVEDFVRSGGAWRETPGMVLFLQPLRPVVGVQVDARGRRKGEARWLRGGSLSPTFAFQPSPLCVTRELRRARQPPTALRNNSPPPPQLVLTQPARVVVALSHRDRRCAGGPAVAVRYPDLSLTIARAGSKGEALAVRSCVSARDVWAAPEEELPAGTYHVIAEAHEEEAGGRQPVLALSVFSSAAAELNHSQSGGALQPREFSPPHA